VDPAGFDADFGVVPVDPRNHTYAVLVDAPTAERLGAESGTSGPFANPRIEPFGPPEPRD
jgi:hypothetical protein